MSVLSCVLRWGPVPSSLSLQDVFSPSAKGGGSARFSESLGGLGLQDGNVAPASLRAAAKKEPGGSSGLAMLLFIPTGHQGAEDPSPRLGMPVEAARSGQPEGPCLLTPMGQEGPQSSCQENGTHEKWWAGALNREA